MENTKTVPVNSAEVEQKMAETFKSVLKQRAAQYVPRDPNTAEAQFALLTMIEGVLPPVSVCIKSAQTQLWPQLKQGKITAAQSAQACTNYIEKLLGITKLENLNLSACDGETLVKAWAALAYFQRFSQSQSGALKNFRSRIASVLMEQEYSKTAPTGSTAAAAPKEDPVTQDVPDKKKPKEPSGTPAAGRGTEKKPKTGGKKSPAPVIAVILVLVLAVGGFLFYQNSQVSAAEAAIEAIGTVTMESLSLIETAEQTCADLSESLRAKVENYETLTAARAEYDRLTAKLQEAKDAINAIGTVSLNSEKQIRTARKAYDALEADNLTDYAAQELETLTSAEALYSKYYAESLYDAAASLYKDGKYQGALAAYESLLAQYPMQSVAVLAKKDAASCLVHIAEAAYEEKNYETSLNSLKKARDSYGDSQENQELQKKVEEKLSKIRPDNGEIIEKNLSWGYGELIVTAGTHDICYKLVSKDDPEKIVMIYVRAGKSKSVKIKNGEYSFYYTSGDHWFGNDVGFGADAVYKKANGTLNFTTYTEGNYIYYRKYDLEVMTDTTSDFGATNCPASEFWG